MNLTPNVFDELVKDFPPIPRAVGFVVSPFMFVRLRRAAMDTTPDHKTLFDTAYGLPIVVDPKKAVIDEVEVYTSLADFKRRVAEIEGRASSTPWVDAQVMTPSDEMNFEVVDAQSAREFERQMSGFKDWAFRAARHIRNTDRLDPLPWGIAGIELLAELQALDPSAYSEKVK